MRPNNVQSALVVGDNFEHTLLQIAISLAENGLHVWFISPKIFDDVPANIKTLDKEILQLITFMYLKDQVDLITQFNGIHLWRKLPDAIIVTDYQHYCSFSESYSPLRAAFLTTTLIDSAAVCAFKNKKVAKLLVTCSQPCDADLDKLQVLKDLYFDVYMCKSENNELIRQVAQFFEQNVL